MSITNTFPALPSQGEVCKAAIVCADTFTMSVQASAYHYCTPRNNTGPYTAFEVGYPSEMEELLLPYAEDKEHPTDTVYGWVPAEVIDKVIEKHGGFIKV